MSQPNVSRHHADWLSLVEVSGPFVSLPVVTRVFSDGLPKLDQGVSRALRAAYETWQDNPIAPGLQRAWVLYVLNEFLGYPATLLLEGQAMPAGLAANMPEMGETLRPDFALVGPAGSDSAGQAQLLIASYPPDQALDKPVTGKLWKATPATRMMELLHGADVPLGLVTNGERWMLVYAPRGETTGYASWFSSLWLDEVITLRAFHALLSTYRFFSAATNSTLLAMLKESASDQQEVTDQLGYQVREAVEVLVQSFDALDRDSKRELLKGVSPKSQYEAALTVMMRLVFLFSAEERDLLHLGKPLYDNNYAVSTLQEQLQEVADRYGEEVLERRTDAWARLLATFRAVHGGVQHQDLLMQAYGGSLFDPDRYPFLEGRALATHWRSAAAEPLAVNNRVVLHLLNSLQRLRTKGAGGSTETRRVSFRALGVEQIGHVYEGLLDHTAVRASEPVLGIIGTRKKEAEIPLSKLEELLAQGADKLVAFLKEETSRSPAALRRALDEGSLLDEHRLLVACGQDEALLTRLRPFVGLIREDSFERPLVIVPGSVYVTAGTTRRSTGTHYTPPSLTEPIVRHTLEPLVYEGPSEGRPREQWQLKTPKEILDLKVCDMAMGSGAFLVQACRYLAERLIEAWSTEEQKHPGEVLITPDGKFSVGNPSERLVPADAAERIAIARRVVADRCLYGVDINPMAVEMAKLSMWLITVDKSRPFTFLDHAFKCGDSLLGITSLEQLENFSLRPGGGKQQAFSTLNLWRHIEEAKKKREILEGMPSDTPEQIAAKAALYAEAEEAIAKLNAAADVLVSVELRGLKEKAYNTEREATAEQMMAYWEQGQDKVQMYALQSLSGRRCFHWALAFPEVNQTGFDAVVGNPPFLGGKKISGTVGEDYREFVATRIGNGVKGHADICAYFFLRAREVLKKEGMAGLIATNTIAQGDTLDVGLYQLEATGISITRAISSTPWPGVAALDVALIWMRNGKWSGCYVLNDQCVPSITPRLSIPGGVTGIPFRLSCNLEKSFIGSYVLGKGFILCPQEAEDLIMRNNQNSLCLLPYLNGDDINTRPDRSPSRWVINFHDWPLSREAHGSWTASDQKQQKMWLRDGVVPKDYPGQVAADFPDLLTIIEKNVKPERTRKKASGEFQLRYPLFAKWWIYADKRPALYAKLAKFPMAFVKTQVSPTWAFEIARDRCVFDQKVVVIFDVQFAVLQSSIHWAWAVEYGSTLGSTTYNYNPTDCVETYFFPPHSKLLDDVGGRYLSEREKAINEFKEGLTKVYNRFNTPSETCEVIENLRRLQVEIDCTVAKSYGWQDLDLAHGFHETKQGIRFTISEAARREVLDRLLALNHQQHAEEVTAAAKQEVKPTKRSRKQVDRPEQPSLDF